MKLFPALLWRLYRTLSVLLLLAWSTASLVAADPRPPADGAASAACPRLASH